MPSGEAQGSYERGIREIRRRRPNTAPRRVSRERQEFFLRIFSDKLPLRRDEGRDGEKPDIRIQHRQPFPALEGRRKRVRGRGGDTPHVEGRRQDYFKLRSGRNRQVFVGS